MKPLIDSLLNTASVSGAKKWTLPPKLGLAWGAICKEVLESARTRFGNLWAARQDLNAG